MLEISEMQKLIKIIFQKSNLILKALENKFSLLILILSNSILCFKLIVLHRFRIIQVYVLRVEHMST